MLKKAGIVVAAAAVGFLALSPVAFADEEIDNSVKTVQKNDCDFEQSQTATGSTGPLPAVLPSLGAQTQTDNCTNESDTEELLPALPPVIPPVIPPIITP